MQGTGSSDTSDPTECSMPTNIFPATLRADCRLQPNVATPVEVETAGPDGTRWFDMTARKVEIKDEQGNKKCAILTGQASVNMVRNGKSHVYIINQSRHEIEYRAGTLVAQSVASDDKPRQ